MNNGHKKDVVECIECGKKHTLPKETADRIKKFGYKICCFSCGNLEGMDIIDLPEDELICIKCNSCEKYTSIKIKCLTVSTRMGGKKCYKCRCKKYSDTMKRTMGGMSPDERKANGAYGQSCISEESHSNAVKKQWETIRADKDLCKKICDARSIRSKEMWEKRSEEERNRIIKILSSSCNKSRSKFSEAVKKAMQDGGMYDGFVSEEVFHGFIPDEINHDLKIIIEMYGDLYHCNPRKYKDPDMYVRAIQRTVGEQWKRDRIRLACFYKHGYNVVIVWEKDFTNRPEETIKRIKNEIDKKRKP